MCEVYKQKLYFSCVIGICFLSICYVYRHEKKMFSLLHPSVEVDDMCRFFCLIVTISMEVGLCKRTRAPLLISMKMKSGAQLYCWKWKSWNRILCRFISLVKSIKSRSGWIVIPFDYNVYRLFEWNKNYTLVLSQFSSNFSFLLLSLNIYNVYSSVCSLAFNLQSLVHLRATRTVPHMRRAHLWNMPLLKRQKLVSLEKSFSL